MMKNKKMLLVLAAMLMVSFLTKAIVEVSRPGDFTVFMKGDHPADDSSLATEQERREQQERLQAQEAARERALNLGLGDQKPTMLSGKTLSTIPEGEKNKT